MELNVGSHPAEAVAEVFCTRTSIVESLCAETSPLVTRAAAGIYWQTAIPQEVRLLRPIRGPPQSAALNTSGNCGWRRTNDQTQHTTNHPKL